VAPGDYVYLAFHDLEEGQVTSSGLYTTKRSGRVLQTHFKGGAVPVFEHPVMELPIPLRKGYSIQVLRSTTRSGVTNLFGKVVESFVEPEVSCLAVMGHWFKRVFKRTEDLTTDSAVTEAEQRAQVLLGTFQFNKDSSIVNADMTRVAVQLMREKKCDDIDEAVAIVSKQTKRVLQAQDRVFSSARAALDHANARRVMRLSRLVRVGIVVAGITVGIFGLPGFPLLLAYAVKTAVSVALFESVRSLLKEAWAALEVMRRCNAE